MNIKPDPDFIHAITTNIDYWRHYLNGQKGLQTLTKEHENLLRAVEFGLVLPDTQIQAAQLAYEAYPFVERRGYWQAWIPILERAIAVCVGDHVWLRCKLLNHWGQLLRMTQKYNVAIAAHKESEETAQRLGDAQAVIEAKFNLSEDYRLNQQPDESKKIGEQALEEARKTGSANRWQASILNTLGLAAQDVDDFDLAQMQLAEAVQLWRTENNATQLARSINNLANVYLARQEYKQALPLYCEAAKYLSTTDSELDKSRVQLSLGSLLYSMEAYEQSEIAFRQADSLTLQQSGNSYLLGAQAQNLGNTLVKQGRFAEAEFVLHKAVAHWKNFDDPVMLANSMGTLAEALAAQLDATAADELYRAALSLLEPHETQFARQIKEEFLKNRRDLDMDSPDGELVD